MRRTGTQVDTRLTPEERRELVTRPLPVIRVIGGTRTWGGTSVTDWCGEKPSRAYTGGSEWLKHLGD
jgi:hypothetical protein